MKISFDNWNRNPNIEQTTAPYFPQDALHNVKNGAYSYEKQSVSVDNNAYGNRGRSIKDMMQSMGNEFDNLSAQRDAMTVLSNMMSAEDFNKMMKDGFDPSALEPDQIVTIVDHIKAEMAKSGKVVSGYNDDLSHEKLTEILGSSARADKVEQSLKTADIPISEENVTAIKETLDKAEELTSIDDAGKKYMLENHLEPTVENIYRAGFSAHGDGTKQSKGYFSQEMPGYYAKKAEVTDYKSMEPQLMRSIGKMDLGEQTEEESLQQAKWLIDKGIPVTEQTMKQLGGLLSISFPLDESMVISAAVDALTKGRATDTGVLSDSAETIYEKANRYTEEAMTVSQEAVMETVLKEQEINLRNLSENQKKIISGEISKERTTQLSSMMHMEAESSVKFIHASRTLAEVQLRMSADANIRLLKSDYAIDTMPLTQLVDALKQQEQDLAETFFGKDNSGQIQEKAVLFTNTNSILWEIPYLPVSVIGRVRAAAQASLTAVHTEGAALRAQYQAAGISYETLMTSPRADLGDSIKKAFGNVDEILTDMGQELSDDNRKAVRILGYNNTEITKEAITEVKETFLQVENVVRAMTPQRTLALIREGVNPLTMELGELEKYLNQMDHTPEEETSKYSRYLYELERSGQISESERGAYIGIYRTFHQIDKSDGAVIGSVMNQGAELTLGNLLTAVRNKKAGRMDYTVDDEFGSITEIRTKGTSITDQIERGIAEVREAKSVFRNLSAEALQQMDITEDTTLAQLKDMLVSYEANKAADAESELQKEWNLEWKDAARQNLEAVANVDIRVMETLQKNGIALTADTVLAAKDLFENKGSLMKRIKHFADQTEEKTFTEENLSVTEKFTDFESAQNAMEIRENSLSSVLNTAMSEIAESSVDVKTISLCFKQLSLITSLRKQENYEVPMEIDGEVTSVNVTLVHDAEEKGIVTITLETEQFGKAGAKFKVVNDVIESYFVADSELGKERLETVGVQMLQTLEENGFRIGNTNYVNLRSQGRKDLNFLTFSDSNVDNNSKTVATAKLYEVAKTFLSGLQKQ